MVKSAPPKNQIQKRTKSLIRLTQEQNLFFTISPVHVLIISVFFIGTVYLLHLFAKLGGKTSLAQILVAVVTLIISIGYALYVHKKNK